MKTVIEMAREAGLCTWLKPPEYFVERIEAFAELVRADEAKRYKWDIHSCGPTCTKVACVAMREAVLAEREACAMVCDELPAPDIYSHTDKSMWDVTCMDCATAIRARGTT